jgi:hypothetical protein
VPLSASSERVRFKTATIDVKFIWDGPDPCDPEKVKLRAQSISETGPRMPPAVRLMEETIGRPDVPLYEVLTDRCQVEALKSLGATTIKCVVVDRTRMPQRSPCGLGHTEPFATRPGAVQLPSPAPSAFAIDVRWKTST